MKNSPVVLKTVSAEGVWTLTLGRPDRRNAIDGRILEEMLAALEEGAKSDARMLVLRGAGPVFCSGGDLNWMVEATEKGWASNLENAKRIALLFAKINAFPRPVIAAVQGAVLGAGIGVLAACDFAVASSETVFGLSEARLGIVPACIAPFVLGKIGASHARQLLLTGRRISAQRALEIGLVHQVVSTAAELDAAVLEVGESVLKCGPTALSEAKKLLLGLSQAELTSERTLEFVAMVLASLRGSEEGVEGMKAFLEGKTPGWVVRK